MSIQWKVRKTEENTRKMLKNDVEINIGLIKARNVYDFERLGLNRCNQ